MAAELAELLQISSSHASALLAATAGSVAQAVDIHFERSISAISRPGSASADLGAAPVVNLERQRSRAAASSSSQDATPLMLAPLHVSSQATDVFLPSGRPAKQRRVDGAPEFTLKDNSGDKEHPSPEQFQRYPLYPQQRRSLGFMVNRERRRELYRGEGACGGVLGDRMGYGKTATTIALVVSEKFRPVPPNPAPQQYFASNATLIIVPEHLLLQWQSEFKKFLASNSVKMLVIRTLVDLKKVTFQQLADVDVVLTTYQVSMKHDLYKRRVGVLAGIADPSSHRFQEVQIESFPDHLRGKSNYTTAQKLECFSHARIGSRTGLLCEAFPVFEAFYWRRLVMDEFHESELWETAQREMLKFIPAHFRWGLSGTPPVGDAVSVEKMAQLFGVNLRALESLMEFKRREQGLNLKDFHNKETGKTAMLQKALDHFVRQNATENLVPLEEKCVEVYLTPQEYLLYKQECMDVGVLSPESEDSSCLRHDLRARLLRKSAHFCCDAGVSSTSGAFLHIKAQKEKQVSVHEAQLCMDSARFELLSAAACGRSELSRATAARVLSEANPGSPELDSSIAKAIRASDKGHSEAKIKYIFLPPCADFESYMLEQPVPLKTYLSNDSKRRLLSNALIKSDKHKLTKPEAQEAARVQENALAHLLAALDASQRSLAFFRSQLHALQGSDQARTCSICMDEDIPLKDLAITFCAHTFHVACIRSWLDSQNRCPMCNHSPLAMKDVSSLSAELGPQAVSVPTESAKPDDPLRQRFGGKLQAVAKTLKKIRAEDSTAKALVFSQWQDILDKIAEALRAHAIPYLRLGGHSDAEVLKDFQERASSPWVLLLSLEKAASGTNLTAANHVLFVSPMCADSLETAIAYEKQAIGRVRRPGQQKDRVHVWRFISRGTVEEHISRRHQAELDNRND